MKVRIKTLNQLVSTPGIRVEDRDIFGPKCNIRGNVFTEGMRELCGEIVEINATFSQGHPHLGNNIHNGTYQWMIFDWMVVGKSEGFNDLYLKLCGE